MMNGFFRSADFCWLAFWQFALTLVVLTHVESRIFTTTSVMFCMLAFLGCVIVPLAYRSIKHWAAMLLVSSSSRRYLSPHTSKGGSHHNHHRLNGRPPRSTAAALNAHNLHQPSKMIKKNNPSSRCFRKNNPYLVIQRIFTKIIQAWRMITFNASRKEEAEEEIMKVKKHLLDRSRRFISQKVWGTLLELRLRCGSSWIRARSYFLRVNRFFSPSPDDEHPLPSHLPHQNNLNVTGTNSAIDENACSTSSPLAGSKSSHGGGTPVTIDKENNEKDEERIRQIWSHNVQQGLEEFILSAKESECVAMDMEFPGFIYHDSMFRKHSDTPVYTALWHNVNALKPVQLGLTVGTKKGGQKTWQINFEFDVHSDRSMQKSIDFLTEAGIDWERHREEGIPISQFLKHFEEFDTTGITWVSFHGLYDFGYLTHMLTSNESTGLPFEQTEFEATLDRLFPKRCDIKQLLNCGSLSDLGHRMRIPRDGQAHQAGSDALLTYQVYKRIQLNVEAFYNDTARRRRKRGSNVDDSCDHVESDVKNRAKYEKCDPDKDKEVSITGKAATRDSDRGTSVLPIYQNDHIGTSSDHASSRLSTSTREQLTNNEKKKSAASRGEREEAEEARRNSKGKRSEAEEARISERECKTTNKNLLSKLAAEGRRSESNSMHGEDVKELNSAREPEYSAHPSLPLPRTKKKKTKKRVNTDEEKSKKHPKQKTCPNSSKPQNKQAVTSVKRETFVTEVTVLNSYDKAHDNERSLSSSSSYVHEQCHCAVASSISSRAGNVEVNGVPGGGQNLSPTRTTGLQPAQQTTFLPQTGCLQPAQQVSNTRGDVSNLVVEDQPATLPRSPTSGAAFGGRLRTDQDVPLLEGGPLSKLQSTPNKTHEHLRAEKRTYDSSIEENTCASIEKTTNDHGAEERTCDNIHQNPAACSSEKTTAHDHMSMSTPTHTFAPYSCCDNREGPHVCIHGNVMGFTEASLLAFRDGSLHSLNNNSGASSRRSPRKQQQHYDDSTSTSISAPEMQENTFDDASRWDDPFTRITSAQAMARGRENQHISGRDNLQLHHDEHFSSAATGSSTHSYRTQSNQGPYHSPEDFSAFDHDPSMMPYGPSTMMSQHVDEYRTQHEYSDRSISYNSLFPQIQQQAFESVHGDIPFDGEHIRSHHARQSYPLYHGLQYEPFPTRPQRQSEYSQSYHQYEYEYSRMSSGEYSQSEWPVNDVDGTAYHHLMGLSHGLSYETGTRQGYEDYTSMCMAHPHPYGYNTSSSTSTSASAVRPSNTNTPLFEIGDSYGDPGSSPDAVSSFAYSSINQSSSSIASVSTCSSVADSHTDPLGTEEIPDVTENSSNMLKHTTSGNSSNNMKQTSAERKLPYNTYASGVYAGRNQRQSHGHINSNGSTRAHKRQNKRAARRAKNNECYGGGGGGGNMKQKEIENDQHFGGDLGAMGPPLSSEHGLG